MITKLSYKQSINKKNIRNFLLNKFKFDNVVGLGGPDINDYINNIKTLGCNSFQIYERESAIILQQLATLSVSDIKISLNYGDILNAKENQESTLYDLDFCSTIKNMEKYIQKFQNNFIMTFSLRMGLEETIETFFKMRKETILSQKQFEDPINYTLFMTEKSDYIFIKYFDTSAMCCFAKIN